MCFHRHKMNEVQVGIIISAACVPQVTEPVLLRYLLINNSYSVSLKTHKKNDLKDIDQWIGTSSS